MILCKKHQKCEKSDSSWKVTTAEVTYVFINKEAQCVDKEALVELDGENVMTVPEGVDAELLTKVLSNSEMAALLTSLAKTMK